MFSKATNRSLFRKADQLRSFAAKAPGVAQSIARAVESGASKAQDSLGALEKIPGVSPLATTAKKIAGGVQTIAGGVANVRGDAAQVTQRLAPVVRKGVKQIGTAF
jgi:hypothetical protein